MQTRRLRHSALLLLLVMSLTIVAAAQDDPGDGAQQVLRADERFNQAVATRDRELFASMIAEDATFMGGGVAKGREAVVEAWSPLLAEDRRTVLSWQPHSAEISASGDLGYTIGSYELRALGEDGKETVATGTYVSIWKKHEDGSWKVVVDGGTPPQPVATEPAD